MRTVLVCFVCLTLLLILAKPIFARTWYIKADGSGDASSIQSGINNAASGDTILLAAGIFYENINTAITITIIGENGPEFTTIDGGEQGRVITAQYINLNGVTIQNGLATNIGGGGISGNGRIDDCIFQNNWTRLPGVQGGAVNGPFIIHECI